MPSHTFEAIGTRWTIATDVPLSASTAAALKSRAEQFDASYSRFRADSLVGQVAERAGSYQFPSDAEPLFSLYRKLYQVTGGPSARWWAGCSSTSAMTPATRCTAGPAPSPFPPGTMYWPSRGAC